MTYFFAVELGKPKKSQKFVLLFSNFEHNLWTMTSSIIPQIIFFKEWINWEPCGQGCGPGMPECPEDEKCQTTNEYEGSPLLCHGRCEKVTSFQNVIKRIIQKEYSQHYF